MANSDKNIRITTSKNKTTYPNIVFTGSAAGSSVITLEVLDDNTLSFTSNEGQVFSIDSNLSSGTIWAVSDISGVPLLSSSAGGTVGLAVYGGIVGIGQTNPIYKLDLKGSFGLASSNDGLYNFIFSNSAVSGSNSLSIRSANSLLLYNSGNTFYTGFKSNAATNITYTLPTTDGSSGQFLQTNGSATLTWATATGSGGTGSTAGVGQGGQYEMAYYPGTGLSVIGSNTFTNNTVTGVVSITHATVATDSSTGAFKVTGGVGIGGSLYVGGIGASITGVTFSNSTITRGTWNGTAISTTYGGTGQNLGSSSGVLTISSGTVSASTTSSAILSAITDETGSGVLVFNTQPSFGTGVTTGDATFAVFNTNATTINAFGAATAMNIGAATGKATFNSTDNSISSTTGGLVVSGGAGFAKSISVAGRLQLLNGANVTAFVSSGTGNTVYTLPATTPATGSSVLQSTAEGVMSWVPMVASSSSGAGSGTVAIPNAQHSVAYYAGTGASVSGSATFTNNTSTGVVNISHATVSTTSATGALTVSGGVGIGGSLYVGGIGASISGLSVIQGVVNQGTWAGSTITAFYGGTGFNTYTKGDILVGFGNTFIRQGVGSDNFVLTASATSPSGVTWVAVPASAASSVAVISTVLDQVFYPTVVSAVSGAGLGLSTVPFIQINPARGTFAAVGISAGTAITVVGNAVASSTTTGALQVIGGVGIGGSLFVGSASRFSATNVASSSGTGALTVSGGVGIGGSLYVASASQFESSVASINVGSGALVVTGGVGIGGSINAGGASRFSSTATAISIGTGALTVTGGAGIAGSLYVGEASRFTSSIASLNSGTGALTVTGGVGIGGSLNVALPSEFEATTAAIDVGSGALVVTGGVGIGGSVFAGGASRFTSSASSISSGTGALTVTGGVGIGGSVFTSTSVPSSISGVVLNNGLVTVGTWSGSTITSFYGGTGFNTYAVGDILYAATATSLGKLPSGSTNQVLTAQGPGTAPIWAAVPPSAASSVAVSSTVVDAVFYPTVISAASGTGLGLSTVNTIQINPARGTFAAVGISAGTAITVVGTAAAINTTTGALQAIGGVGIGGSLYVAGASRFSSSIAAISNGTGALTVTGGAGIGGSLYVGDASRFESNINSTTPGVGGLIATGGVGIGLSVSIGGRLQMFNGSLYTAFASAQSGVNTTYILPPTSPSSAGASFLTSTQAGVMAWVAAPAGGGGGSPSGSVGDVQYNSGTGNFAASSTFNYANATGMLKTINYNTGSSTNFALLIGENNSVNFTGSATGTLLALSNTSLNGAQYNFIDAKFDNGSPPSNLSVFKVDYVGKTTVADLTITSSSYATRTNNNTLTTSASQAANLTYTLPLAYPSGTGTSFLSASTTGVMAWVAAPSGGSSGAGSGTVAIPNAQYSVAYYAGTGASVSGSNTFTNNTSTGVVEITHTTESTSTTTGAFQVDGGAGIAKSLFVGTTLSVGTTPSYNIPNNLASFVSTVNSYNQLVIQNKSNGTSASANLVVNNDISTDAANYGEIGMNSSTFTGSGALFAPNATYLAATSGPLVLGTTTSHPIRFTVNNGATDTIYIHEAGTAISVFTNFDLRAQNDVRFFNADNSRYAAIQASNVATNYTLSLPTAPVGNGYSTILVDTSGNMFFAPLEGGLATTSVTGNRVVLRNKMEHHVWMAAGYTPLAAGPDNIIYLIPDSSEDGATKQTFILTEFNVRVETPSAGSSRIQLERSSTDTGAFTLAATGSSLIGGSGLTLSGAGIYVTTTNTFVAGTFVTSGNLLRLNFNLLNATHANFSVSFTLNEV